MAENFTSKNTTRNVSEACGLRATDDIEENASMMASWNLNLIDRPILSLRVCDIMPPRPPREKEEDNHQCVLPDNNVTN